MELSDLQFVHLRTHTDFSLHQGSIRYQELAKFAANEPQRCIAITDNNNLFAAIKFYKSARRNKVKPILGIDCQLRSSNSNQQFTWTLLAMNEEGYMNLKKISSAFYANHKNSVLRKEYIFEHSAGLIILSGGVVGEIGQQLIRGNVAAAKIEMEQWLQFFEGRFYIELQRTGAEHEEQYIADALVLAEIFSCPVVATNNACFTTSDDFYAHEIRVCISQKKLIGDPSRKSSHSVEQYLKTSTEMTRLFKDIPEALTNSVEIAKRCTVEIELGKNHLPRFDLEEGKTFDVELRQLAESGLLTRIRNDIDAEDTKPYYQRLEKELTVIEKTGFSAYFLIVQEFMQWSHDNHIPVGPGRGSAAGSLVAYSLSITNIDPLRYGLLFERFLNEERLSMPDMDIDFSVMDRDKVIDHVREKYGRDAVGQIITFGTIAAKNAIRDTARVLGHPYGLGNKLAKLLANTPGLELENGISQSEELKQLIENDQVVADIVTNSLKIEGLVRQVGVHAAGVVIAPSTLIDFSPLYYDPMSQITITQFDKNDIEAVGLVKFDFLGLKTLTILQDALTSIRNSYNLPIDLNTLPLDDKPTFELLSDGDTDGVFQLESIGMKRNLKKLAPSSFDEIIAMLALYRPGPMQFIDDYINRKHGREAVTYPHPSLESILKDTFAIAVYQEQVMHIAQEMAGYSLGNADLLRRAMGKKDSKIMKEEKETFISGAIKKGVEASIAQQVFGFIEKFAEYGFNKSHSAAYAILSYQTAWMKTHYPADFFISVMNNDRLEHEKLYRTYRNCKKRGITLLPPHVNHSSYDFNIHENNEIIFGLGGIKGVGFKVAQSIESERQLAPFRNLFDFCNRIDRGLLDNNLLDALVCSGAFDGLGSTRAEMFVYKTQALRLSEQTRENSRQGIGDLFGGVDTKEISQYHQSSDVTLWSNQETFDKEKKYIGFYLSGHPCDQFSKDISGSTTHSLEPFSELGDIPQVSHAVVAGAIVAMSQFITDKNETIHLITLDDKVNMAQFRVSAEFYPKDDSEIIISNVITLELAINKGYKGYNYVSVTRILPIQEARYAYARALQISLVATTTSIQITIQSLRVVLAQHLKPEGKPVYIQFIKSGVVTRLQLGEHWKLDIHPDFLQELLTKCPNVEISPIYHS